MTATRLEHADAAFLSHLEQALSTYATHPEWVDGPTSSVSGGGAIQAAEDAFAQHVGTEFAVLLPSATYGMRQALAAIGVGRGDHVLIPAFDWTANRDAVLSLQATPIPVAVDPETITIDPRAAIRQCTPRTKAIIATHTHGVPADVPALAQLGIPVLEDMTGAFGAELAGDAVGTLGDMAVLSLGPGKEIDCGEGAVLFTNDPALWQHVVGYSTHPIRQLLSGTQYVQPGFSVRVHPVTALLALVGLNEWNLDERRASAKKARDAVVKEGLTPLTGGNERTLATPWIPILTPPRQVEGLFARRTGARELVGPRGTQIRERSDIQLVTPIDGG